MRLLGMNAFVSLPIILIFSIFNLQAEEKCKKELIATNDNIVICAKEGLRQVDGVLNEEYRTLMTGLEEKRKQELIYTQRIWLKYREGYCHANYDLPDLGEEAAGDKLSCLAQITGARISEIVTLRAGLVIDGFYGAANALTLKTPGLDFDDAVKFLSGEPGGNEWNNYAVSHCGMVVDMDVEDMDSCMARMRFHLYGN